MLRLPMSMSGFQDRSPVWVNKIRLPDCGLGGSGRPELIQQQQILEVRHLFGAVCPATDNGSLAPVLW